MGETMPDRIQVLAIAVSVAFLVLVLELVRRRKLVEEYSFLWIVVAVIVLAVSIWRELLHTAANHGLARLTRPEEEPRKCADQAGGTDDDDHIRRGHGLIPPSGADTNRSGSAANSSRHPVEQNQRTVPEYS